MIRLTAVLCGLGAALTLCAASADAQTRIALQEGTRAISVQPAPASDLDARRDYELAERVGTRAAWDAFLSVHPSGFYATLARSLRDKLAGAAPAAGLEGSDTDATQTDASNLSKITVLPPPGANGAKSPLASLPAAGSGGVKETPPVKPLVCGAGKMAQGDRCVAIPAATKRLKKKEAAPEPSPRERVRVNAPKPRESLRVRVREERFSRPVQARASCPSGSSPMSQGGRMCCEITPERGASRIFCL